jgi:hypothetical protein
MVLSDSRIPPKGFVPSVTTMPLGEIDFKDGGGGYRDYDEATFSLTAPAGLTGAFILSARVYYQSMTRDYVEFLRDANTTSSHGEALYAIYEATGAAPPTLVASSNFPVTFGGGGDGGGGGSGGGSGDAGGAGGSSGSGGGAAEPSGCDCRAAGARSPGFGAAIGAILVLGLSAARRNRRKYG